MPNSLGALLPVKPDNATLMGTLNSMRANTDFMSLAEKYAPLRGPVVASMVSKLQIVQSGVEAAHALPMSGGVMLVPNAIMVNNMYANRYTHDVEKMPEA